MKHLGKSYKKKDSATILSGKAAYTEDFIPANALCIKIKTCLRLALPWQDKVILSHLRTIC